MPHGMSCLVQTATNAYSLIAVYFHSECQHCCVEQACKKLQRKPGTKLCEEAASSNERSYMDNSVAKDICVYVYVCIHKTDR